MIAWSAGVSRWSLLYTIVAFLLVGFFAGRNVSSWPARISYPGEESYEGAALAEVALLGRGGPVYAAASPSGFSGMTYGPLYYIVGSHLINPYAPSYLPLRIFSAFAILGCAAECALLAFRLTRSRLAACLSPLVFLSYGIVTFHGVSALSDNVALFLFFTGFLLAHRFRESRAILFAVPLMALGFYYKPQFIAGPLAVLAYLALEKHYSRAAQFAALLAGSGMVLFAIFEWVVFRGQEFWRHFLLFQAALFSWRQWEMGLLVFTLMLAAPVLLASEFLRKQPDRMMACYLVSAVVLGIVTIGKATAFIQYFYESILSVSLLVPGLLAKRIAQGRGVIEVMVLLAIGLIAGQWFTPPAPNGADRGQHEALQSFFKSHFASDARALGFREGDLIQAGFETPFSDLFQTEILARRGIISDRYLITEIQNRAFSLIVLDFNLETERDGNWLNYYLTANAREVIAENYELSNISRVPFPERSASRLDRFYIYVPRQPKAWRAAFAPPIRRPDGTRRILK